jgi:hypothetical protein
MHKRKPSTIVKPAAARKQAVEWLLDGDPAIRWQTLRDLVQAPQATVARERTRVARQGWGRELLRRQDASGTWAARQLARTGKVSADGGLYTPKWTSTTYTLLLLRDFGLASTNRQARRGCILLLDRGLERDGGINYGWHGRSETCITGMVLSILSHFEIDDERLETLADYLLEQQMPDGGWNCRRDLGATHASVHTTISVLEALRLYELHRRRNTKAIRLAQARGREFLLVHRLFRSHRTGAVIKPVFVQFSFPPRWHYDILRALDYFQAAGAPRDPRLSEAIEIVRRKEHDGSRWVLENVYRGKTFFPLESLGKPSRWNTLRALRVLRWWDGA